MIDAPKFRRHTPDERRKELIEATLRCLEKKGSEGLSVRNISAEAGISVGLINHHYPSKDDLVAAAYEKLALGLQDYVQKLVDDVADGAPRARMSAYFRGFFSPEVFDRKILRVWVVFWNMTESSPKVRAAHDRTYAAFRIQLEKILADLAAEDETPNFDVRLAAIGLSAMLDGLWLEWCLNSETFSAEEGVRLCEAWVDALLGGSFTRLTAST